MKESWNRCRQLGLSWISVSGVNEMVVAGSATTTSVLCEPCTSISFTPEAMEQLSPGSRHLFDAAFIQVLVRRLHAAHEALAHPRRIL